MTQQADEVTGTPIVVSVRGEANVEADPELCEFAVTVTARDRDRRTALEQLTRRNKELLDQVRAGYGEALEKLETGHFSVYPEWRGKRSEKVGPYQGSVRIRIVVKDFAVLGEMVTEIADGEGRAIDGPYWTLRRDSEVHQRARTEAVGEAVRRAREYAAAVGSTLTQLLELADTGMSGGAPHPGARVMDAVAFAGSGAADEGVPALDLEPVRQNVYAEVEARFSATQPRKL
ncbi:MAG: SIMPL domain-containing protein [Catenulisporales bacterium]|nr:SIMPL domain-containing protein [Catenulisporales bacterium]